MVVMVVYLLARVLSDLLIQDDDLDESWILMD
jgi:hypothetical protein